MQINLGSSVQLLQSSSKLCQDNLLRYQNIRTAKSVRMCDRLVPQNIDRVDNILADTLSIFPSTSFNKYKSITNKAQCCANELFRFGREENNKYCLPINILYMQREQQNSQ